MLGERMEKITHATIKERVSESIRKAILDGKLKPGQSLIQDQIAKE
jgi:DNA-binding GntR family transcriptional regulator